MTSTWRQKYVRPYFFGNEASEDMMFLDSWKESGCWHAVLFNFQSGGWDRKTPYPAGWCGTSQQSGKQRGWIMWELETTSESCFTIPSIKHQSTRVVTTDEPGTPVTFTEDHIAHGYDYNGRHLNGCFAPSAPSYTLAESSSFSLHWIARTPN